MNSLPNLLFVVFLLGGIPTAVPQETLSQSTTGDAELDAYFEHETGRIGADSLFDVRSREEWMGQREKYRGQLREMLGLSPLPERTDLDATITGTVERDDFTVENLHFQSMPGLYVTGNLYLPKDRAERHPAILYVCGHGAVRIDGVSYGNKVTYQHHGEWFARNGYVCLTIDTIQLGELEGIHHGTYREGMWWWNARGYTPAGVEAWNGIRALDYLQSRPEVDADRIGITGRSGGGAYSWWIGALDERVRCAVPVAGITDLRNHVVDGCVEGHCDCMFMVNTYRWNYAKVAALLAPRPLLIANSDKDTIFPLDGVMRVHSQVRHIYKLLDSADKLGVLITEGPHRDTQDLRVPAFRWFNRWLKNETGPVDRVAEKFLEPAQLKVFDSLPADERTTTIHETFVPTGTNRAPTDAADWNEMRDGWMHALREKVFAGWPQDPRPPDLEKAFSADRDSIHLEAWDFNSQPHVRLRLYVLGSSDSGSSSKVTMTVLDDEEWRTTMANLRTSFGDELTAEGARLDSGPTGRPLRTSWLDGGSVVVVAPRGVGLTGFVGNERKRIQIRRRFQLLGQTLDGMRVWDIVRAAAAVRSMPGFGNASLKLRGDGPMGVNVLYAGLFVPDLAEIRLAKLPASHMTGPDYLNVLRFLDIPQAVAMAAERSSVRLSGVPDDLWQYARRSAETLGWNGDAVSVDRD